jgi:hypothetical protein
VNLVTINLFISSSDLIHINNNPGIKPYVIKLFYKILLLSLPFILLTAYSEIKLREIPNSYTIKKTNLEKNIDNIQVLALGSSEAYDGINPDYFSVEGFNLANANQTLLYDNQLLIEYLDKMKSLRLVIITVSYFSFWYQICNTVEHWREYFYYHVYGINNKYNNDLDMKRISYIFLYSLDVSREYFIKNFNIVYSENLHPNGWLQKDSVNYAGLSDSTGIIWVSYINTFRKQENYVENLNNLEKMISELKKRNIVPVLVTPPIYTAYSKYTDPAINEINRISIENLCNKYSCNYFNYENDTRFNRDDFVDIDHLKAAGAEKFSRILNDEIIIKFTK